MFSEKAFLLLTSCAMIMVSSSVIYTDDYDELRPPAARLALIGSDSKGLYEARIKRYPAHLEPNVMAMGSKFWIRPGECPPSVDGDTKYFCPFPHPNGRFSCLDSWELCDGVKNCPEAADENPMHCLFYKATQSQLQTLFAAQRRHTESSLNPANPHTAPAERRTSNRNYYFK